MTERHHRVEARGAPGRPKAGRHSGADEDRHDQYERHRRGRARLREQTLEQPINTERSSQAYRYPDRELHQGLSEDEPLDPSLLRTECDPEPQLMRTLSHRVCSHGLKSGRRENERDGGEDREQRAENPKGPQLPCHQLIHSLDVEEWQIRLDGPHHVTDERRHSGRVSARPQDQAPIPRRVGLQGLVHDQLRPGIGIRKLSLADVG